MQCTGIKVIAGTRRRLPAPRLAHGNAAGVESPWVGGRRVWNNIFILPGDCFPRTDCDYIGLKLELLDDHNLWTCGDWRNSNGRWAVRIAPTASSPQN